MLETERGRVLITDAWTLYADAIEMLEQGHIRNAAEKAWGAHQAGNRRPDSGAHRTRTP